MRWALERKLGHLGVVTTTLEEAVNWGRTGFMWPMMFGLTCCAVDEIMPVDVYVAGCPPRPEALMDGILMLHAKVKKEKLETWG